jgi:adenylosuccinate lyase
MSEHGYMQRRVQVEVAWFIALSDAGFAEFKPLTTGARAYLAGLVKNFSEADRPPSRRSKRPPTTT